MKGKGIRSIAFALARRVYGGAQAGAAPAVAGRTNGEAQPCSS